MRIFALLGLLLLTACQAPQLPTSERLEIVRAQKQDALAQELATADLQLGAPAFIRVFKEEKILETWVQKDYGAGYNGSFEPFKAYKICHISGTIGPKLREGDHQGPEGFYEITADQMNPWSQFHLSFNIGFPNAFDRAQGYTGSHLMIHGGCKSEGCYAMTDAAMEEIYLLTEASIANGANVPIHIFPFRMTEANMAKNEKYIWADFWWNLKEGHDAFEVSKIPPEIIHQDNHYKIIKRRDTEFQTIF